MFEEWATVVTAYLNIAMAPDSYFKVPLQSWQPCMYVSIKFKSIIM